MTTLTLNELIVLVNHTPMHALPIQNPTKAQCDTPKKRIGLMPIDKRVYEWLDKPSDDLFASDLAQ